MNLILTIGLLWTSLAIGQIGPIPALVDPVMDQARMLSPEAKRHLDRKLRSLRNRRGPQIVIYTVESLNNQAIEDYAVRVFENWKLGQGGKDDGLLLLVSMQDRQFRFEVGYGLEGILTDLKSKRMLEEYLVPRFREGRADDGFIELIDATIELLSGQEPSPPQRHLPFPLVFVALMALMVILKLLVRPGFYNWQHRRSSYGDWGGFGGGGFGGGSFGGGGFGGGGGRSGGGGASGGW